MRRWQIPSDAEGLSAQQWVAEVLTDGDLKEAQTLVKAGARLNAAAVKPKDTLLSGDIFELYTEETPFAEQSEVVYEDENFIVYNKEQDISCYTEKGELAPKLYELAEQHMRDKGEYNLNSYTLPYITHGIARTTGGLVMVAKDEIIYGYLVEAMAQRRIKRTYRCIVSGIPMEDSMELHHGLSAKDKFSKVSISEPSRREGMPVLLQLRLIRTDGKLSLLEVDLVTDHIAQICAQLGYVGLPVLGDAVYGSARANRRYAAKLPALWASRLDFRVGKNNPLEYLDGMVITADHVKLPYIKTLERHAPRPQKY